MSHLGQQGRSLLSLAAISMLYAFNQQLPHIGRRHSRLSIAELKCGKVAGRRVHRLIGDRQTHLPSPFATLSDRYLNISLPGSSSFAAPLKVPIPTVLAGCPGRTAGDTAVSFLSDPTNASLLTLSGRMIRHRAPFAHSSNSQKLPFVPE